MRIFCIGPALARRYLTAALMESSHSVTEFDALDDAAFVASSTQTPPVHALIVLAAADLAHAAQALATRPAHTVLVIVARDDDSGARAAALTAGADICLPAGYDYAELDARLRAFTRGETVEDRPAASASPRLSAATRSLVSADGAALLLRQREYLLLDCLMRQPGCMVDYDNLIDYVIGEAEADATSLHALVSRLRRRLAQAGIDLALVAEPRAGYRVGPPA